MLRARLWRIHVVSYCAYTYLISYFLESLTCQPINRLLVCDCWAVVIITVCSMHLLTVTTSTKWRQLAMPIWWQVVYRQSTNVMLRKCLSWHWNFWTRWNITWLIIYLTRNCNCALDFTQATNIYSYSFIHRLFIVFSPCPFSCTVTMCWYKTDRIGDICILY